MQNLSQNIASTDELHSGLIRHEPTTMSGGSKLIISENKLQVHLYLNTATDIDNGKKITIEVILELIDESEIKYGFNEKQIETRLEEAYVSGEGECKFLVAEGKPSVSANEDRVKWHLNVNSNDVCKPKDIYKRSVLPGQTIVAIKQNGESSSGIDVYGNEISASNKDVISIVCGEGVEKTVINGCDEYKALWLGVVQFKSNTLTVKSGVKITDDKMKVTMSLLRPDIASDEGNILFPHVVKTLNEHGIEFGIKNDAIKLILENINKERKSKIDLLLAEGVPAKHAVDTKIEYAEELYKTGKILPNGEINYYENSYPWKVKSNDVIGKIISPGKPEDGKNVMGELLPANKVVVSKPVFKGIKKNRDATLRVMKSGVLLVNGLNFQVSTCKEFEENVSQKDGNIDSKDTVCMKGGVEPGIVLNTKGDAIINKNVDNATVSADGDVVIKSGVRGAYSKIICGGDLNTSFAEKAHFNVKGDIWIKNSLINCNTFCQGTVRVGNARSSKGNIIGDTTHAYKGIEVNTLGSDEFIKTIIEVGIGSVSYMRLKGLIHDMPNLEKRVSDLDKLYENCQRSQKSPKEKEMLLEKLSDALEQKNRQHVEAIKEKDKLQAILNETNDAKLIVHERIYPGIVIHIQDKTFEVKEEMNSGIFVLEGEQIIFEPI